MTPGILTGSTGRRRLSPDDFKNLLIPEASEEEQLRLGKLIRKKRALRRELLEKADKEIVDLDNEMLANLFDSKEFIFIPDDSVSIP